MVTVAVVFSSSLALLAISWVWAGPPHDVVALGILAVLGIASWTLRETSVGQRVQISFTSIVMLAAAVLVGPVGAGIVGIVSTLVALGPDKPIVRVFNIGMFGWMATVGAVVYRLAGGAPHADGVAGAAQLLLRVGLPLILADVAQCLTNAVALSLVMRVANGVPVRMHAWKLLSTMGPAYIGYGVIGFLYVVLWVPARVGWFSSVLVLAPLFVARWAFVQYGEEFRAHERTLRALVTAVETKDPHNAGHSERVAKLSEWLAEAIGLGHKEIQEIRTSGMLHDIGKVGVPTRLLRPRRDLNDEELAVFADHAHDGVDLVRGIDFLEGSVDGIAHHHERWDGGGYPDGLAGQAIPLVARIVAVADTFDALTTTRAYRAAFTVDQAHAEVERRAGTQFDPQIVEALGRVLVRHDWATTDRSPELLASAGVALDHDEPEVSDLFAARADLRASLHSAAPRVVVPAGGSV